MTVIVYAVVPGTVTDCEPKAATPPISGAMEELFTVPVVDHVSVAVVEDAVDDVLLAEIEHDGGWLANGSPVPLVGGVAGG